MIFQHTWEKVLSGKKTQTRRLVKPEDTYLFNHGSKLAVCSYVAKLSGRLMWQVGKTYAVQPARTAKAIARIRITDLRREDVRDIKLADVKAEGFVSTTHFWLVWTHMHDIEHYKRYPTTGQQSLAYEQGILAQRPAERYQAWVITFELAQQAK